MQADRRKLLDCLLDGPMLLANSAILLRSNKQFIFSLVCKPIRENYWIVYWMDRCYLPIRQFFCEATNNSYFLSFASRLERNIETVLLFESKSRPGWDRGESNNMMFILREFRWNCEELPYQIWCHYKLYLCVYNDHGNRRWNDLSVMNFIDIFLIKKNDLLLIYYDLLYYYWIYSISILFSFSFHVPICSWSIL